MSSAGHLDVDELTCHQCVPPKHFEKPASLKGHVRWQHPTPLQDEGELCTPPPRTRYPNTHWARRLDTLDASPGRWRRWPYATRNSAYRSQDRARTVLLEERRHDDYWVEVHFVDDGWWVYGLRREGTE